MSGTDLKTWLAALPLAGACLLSCGSDPTAAGDSAAPAAGAETSGAQGGVTGADPGSAPQPRPTSAGPRKLALLVGVAAYERAGLGWGNLHSDRDLAVLERVLARHAFDQVRTLTDGEATRTGILGALRRLIADAAPGDVVLFHYSGHGHQLTDDDGDEIDGYDEMLVPYDAPKSPPTDYAGELHIRDDEMREIVAELRTKLGRDGDLLVTLDSCFSGSGTRGEAAVRGSAEPIGPPRAAHGGAARGADVGGGFADQPYPDDAPAGLAPYAFVSAARHNELAWETVDGDGESLGSLSWALGSALTAAGQKARYRTLFERVRKLMDQRVVNKPQAEGELDRALFGGRAVDQQPFFRVRAVNRETGKARIEGGLLTGLLEGSEVEIHPAESPGPEHTQPLARGKVYRVAATTSDVELTEVLTGEELEGAWCFVTAESFGPLRLRVRIVSQGADWGPALEQALASSNFLEVTTAGAELVVEPESAADPAASGAIVRSAGDGTVLLGPLAPGSEDLVGVIRDRLRDLARNRYLRRLELPPRVGSGAGEATTPIDVEFELEPCRLDCEIDDITGSEICRCREALPLESFEAAGGQLEFRAGDGFRLRLVNRGEEGAHVAILDLKPDGRIGLLWPFVSQSGAADNFLARGGEFAVPVSYRMEGKEGTVVYKLIATRDFVDFRSILSADTRSGQSRGALDDLFSDVLAGTRTGGYRDDGSAKTFELAFTMLRKAGD